jgi:BirA family biotin operon repressor/biotin-[acetyl-CoA-carboxylase] ligase
LDGIGPSVLVLAEMQSAGRGRASNRWWSGTGALTFSLLLDAHASGLPTSCWPQLSLTVGLAIAEAVDELIGLQAGLKWPNDVYLQGRKVAGVLIETPPRQRGKLVVGVGLNVNDPLNLLPEDVRQTAISLCEASNRGPFALADVLILLLQRLSDCFAWIGSRDAELRQRWRERCVLTSRTVHIDQGGCQITGPCHGIDDDGALLVQTEAGLERCFAGVVTQLE